MKLTRLQKYSLITFSIYMLILIWVIGLKCNMEFPIFMSKLSMGQMTLAERAEWSFCYFRFNGDGPIYSKDAIEDMVVNVILFLAVGMTLPMIFKKHKYVWTPICGFGLSLFFEISQFFNTIGGFAYIDLITNTLGAVLGMVATHFILKAIKEDTAVIILKVASVIFSIITVFATVNTIIHIDIYM